MQRLYVTLCTLLAVLSLSTAVFSNSAYAEGDGSSARAPLSYEGWAVIKRNVIDPAAADDEWISMRDITITDDGVKLRVKDGEQDTPYTIELIVITYTQTNTTVLKLALYEEGKDSAITYIWGEPGTERLGMNLRWMQVGLTLAEDQ